MKTAIVTGASSGIGKEICSMLLTLDYEIFGFGRTFDESIIDSDQFHQIQCDLLNTRELTETIKCIRKTHEIDLLINNAGAGYFGPHEELNATKIHTMIVTNLEVPMLLSQLLLRDLKKTQGTIINISSITAKKSNTYGCAYGATKAGLTSFSKSLFDEVRKYGVKVCVIHPDMTKTNFYRNANFKEGDVPESYLLPEEIAEAVRYVLTSRPGFVPTDLTFQPQLHRLTKL